MESSTRLSSTSTAKNFKYKYTNIEKCSRARVGYRKKSLSTSTLTNLANEQFLSCNSSKFVAKTYTNTFFQCVRCWEGASIYLRVLLAVVCHRKFILFVSLLLLAKANCTRVGLHGAFFDLVHWPSSTSTNRVPGVASTSTPKVVLEYEYSRLLEYSITAPDLIKLFKVFFKISQSLWFSALKFVQSSRLNSAY